MPPKTKLHKATGKQKSLPCTSTQNSTPENSNTAVTSPGLEQQFETELCWCIQQLQNALRLGKLNPKQVQDHTKALNTLMSNSAPIVKKRQVMRLSFGDYRAKMAAEDKKQSSVNAKVKLTKGTPSNKSVFVKKSRFTPLDNSFRFEFSSPEDSIADQVSNITIDSKDTMPDKFHFAQSSNEFRFNFHVDKV